MSFKRPRPGTEEPCLGHWRISRTWLRFALALLLQDGVSQTKHPEAWGTMQWPNGGDNAHTPQDGVQQQTLPPKTFEPPADKHISFQYFTIELHSAEVQLSYAYTVLGKRPCAIQYNTRSLCFVDDFFGEVSHSVQQNAAWTVIARILPLLPSLSQKSETLVVSLPCWTVFRSVQSLFLLRQMGRRPCSRGIRSVYSFSRHC